ncbi:MAG: methyl-accepting chemotaxis protein [Methylovirgula sp.]
MQSYFRAIRLTHCFALVIVAFALLTSGSGGIIWTKIVDLQKTDADIINRQYPARVALGEAKASEGVFGVLAYQLKDVKEDDRHEIRYAIKEETRRFRNWLATVGGLCPEASHDIAAVSERFDRLRKFLDDFPKPAAETPDFQLDYRFSALRDDLEASLTHLSLELGREAQDRIEYAQNVKSAGVRNTLEIFAIGFVAFFIGAVVWASLAVARPMLRLADAMHRIASGHFDTAIRYTGRRDEIGEVARAILVFRDKGLSVQRLEQETAATEARAAAALANERQRVVDVFQQEVMEAIAALTSATAELQRNATVMRDIAGATDDRTKKVVAFSQDRIETTEKLFASSSGLTTTITKMNELFVTAGEIATLATGDGRATSKRANELVEAVETIGQIADFIGGVAYQTNLLALNATIEAARCGEAGRGFAVVASEVKMLAHETSRAAANIAQRIETVKSATDQVVAAIGVTVHRIGSIAEMSSQLGDAMDQKDRASRDIARCVGAAADEAQNLSAVLKEVSRSTSETQRVASEILTATDEVSLQSDRLFRRSREFCQQIRVDAEAVAAVDVLPPTIEPAILSA